MEKTHKKMRGFEYLGYSFFAFLLVIVLSMLPLAPVFASENVSEAAEPVQTTAVQPPSEPEPELEPEPVQEEVNEINESTNEINVSDGETSEQSVSDTVATDDEVVGEITETGSNTEDTQFDNGDEIETNNVNEDTSSQPEVAGTSTIDIEIEDVDYFASSTTHSEKSGTTTTSTEETNGSTTTENNTSSTTETTHSGTNPSSANSTESDTITETTAEPSENNPLENEPIDEFESETSGEASPHTSDQDSQNSEENTDAVTSSSTDILHTPDPEFFTTSFVINDQNKYQFSKDQCVSMGDGSFYCTNEEVSDSEFQIETAYSKVDADGDKEIYINIENETIQITKNNVDDDSPYYDELSNTIVWHAGIDGRTQIFEFNFETEQISQLTNERYNNMYPSRSGGATVWQGWVGSDWEIMFENNGDFTMITDNQHHDISPHINGNHVVWQSFEDGSWKVKVYDIATRITETISDSDGGSVENPRFVLVYDAKSDNGDIETRGYDLASGESVPLSATPRPTVPNLPDPEPTSEERALVSQNTQIKVKQGDEIDSDETNDTPLDIQASTTDVITGPVATSTNDIIVTPYIDEIYATSTEEISDVVLTPFDETMESQNASTTSSKIVHIKDVVLPNLELSTSTEPESTIEDESATTTDN